MARTQGLERRNGFAAVAFGLALALAPTLARAQEVGSAPVEHTQSSKEKLDELRAMREDLANRMRAFDARIDELEAQMQGAPPKPKRSAKGKGTPTTASYSPPLSQATAPAVNLTITATSEPAVAVLRDAPPGTSAAGAVLADASAGASKAGGSTAAKSEGYVRGKGYVIASGDDGELTVSLVTYVRYLNQLGLDREYTDSFGRTKTLDLRQDVQFNKVNLSFRGWLFDPDFEYRVWIWTQNPAMGLGAQVVIGGHIGYHFSDYFSLFGGIAPLPGTRTLNWTYPFWLKMDNRTIADEFFRPSYSSGIWADGKIVDDVYYRVMVANNLSALGVDAGQLDGDFGTFAGHVWWMPSTGEYGVGEGIGDYDYHEEVATRFGLHYTRSREDAQSQPDSDDFENVQIRLSDGTLIFQPGAFNTDGRINKATYQMVAANAGFKYEGWSLEGEYYWRWVDEFETTGFIPVTDLYDHGIGVHASTMAVRDELQLYLSGSKVFGEYGEPWDVTVGLNWYPFSRREFHVNVEGIYLDRSPVGGNSYPYLVGADGWLFNTDVILTF